MDPARGRVRSDVAEPLRELAAAIEPEFGEPKIFRPYRDLRFSADRRPYHEYARLGVRPDRADGASTGVLFLALSADGLFLASGQYEPSREQLQRFRTLQDDPAAAADLDETLGELAADGVPLDDGASLEDGSARLVEGPPAHRPDPAHPADRLVQYPPAAQIHDRRCLDLIVEAWRRLDRWNRWLDENVGA